MVAEALVALGRDDALFKIGSKTTVSISRRRQGVDCSMSRSGNVWDNPAGSAAC